MTSITTERFEPDPYWKVRAEAFTGAGESTIKLTEREMMILVNNWMRHHKLGRIKTDSFGAYKYTPEVLKENINDR